MQYGIGLHDQRNRLSARSPQKCGKSHSLQAGRCLGGHCYTFGSPDRPTPSERMSTVFYFTFVPWFRSVAPYIHMHRGKSFVAGIAGEALAAG